MSLGFSPLLSCPPPRLASADAGAGESKKGEADAHSGASVAAFDRVPV
jgi:hypothetical protein